MTSDASATTRGTRAAGSKAARPPLSTADATIGAETAHVLFGDVLGDAELADGTWAGMVIAMGDDSITLELLGVPGAEQHSGPIHEIAVAPTATVRIIASPDNIAERPWSQFPTTGTYTPCPAPGCRVTVRVKDGAIDQVSEFYDVSG